MADFQRNARSLIDRLNETQGPMLLTVSGKAQAVRVDSVTCQQTEERLERARLMAAIRKAEPAIREGRTRPAEYVFAERQAKHGF